VDSIEHVHRCHTNADISREQSVAETIEVIGFHKLCVDRKEALEIGEELFRALTGDVFSSTLLRPRFDLPNFEERMAEFRTILDSP
jgi:hypothetical protein